MLYCSQAQLSPQIKTHLSLQTKNAQEHRMTQVFSAETFNSTEDTLPKKRAEPIHFAFDKLAEPLVELTPEQKHELKQKNEQNTFDIIDNEINAFIGTIGRNLSEVQSATTNPDILVSETSRLLDNADLIIDDGINAKKTIRQQSQLNGGLVDDIEITTEARHQRIIDALLTNRNAREGELEKQNKKLTSDKDFLKESIADYRQYLSEENPAALVAFDAHFQIPEEDDAVTEHAHDSARSWTERFRATVAPYISSRALRLIGIQSPRSAEVEIIRSTPLTTAITVVQLNEL
jgi:hypothetical protein